MSLRSLSVRPQPPTPAPGRLALPYLPPWVSTTLCPPQTTQDTQARCPGPTPQPGCSAGAPLSSLSAPKAKPAGVRGRIGSSQPGPAPSLCCSLQAPDARPQNNSSPQPSGWMRVNSTSSGAQRGVLAQPGTLPNWPGTPSCPSPPRLPINSWHFQPSAIQTRNESQLPNRTSWGLIS